MMLFRPLADKQDRNEENVLKRKSFWDAGKSGILDPSIRKLSF